MNVRFFAGTRATYDSLPVPRNPLGLYFCEDTKELFWADRLLTDGIRVVETFADLPDFSSAADGVVYYVTETRNGYTISPDRSEWLQTIYAPVTDAYEVPESEIYNTVTTVGAVRDIEAQIYKTLDERIANIEISDSGNGIKTISFAGFKLEEVDGVYTIDRRCAREALGFNVPAGLEDQPIDIVTKEYVDEQVAAATGADLSEYAKKTDLADFATESYVQEQIEAIPEIDLGEYAKKSEIPSIEGLASKAELDNIKLDMAKLATEEYVEGKVASIEIPTKVSELDNDAGYLTKHQDLSEYAKKSDIPEAELFVVDYTAPDFAAAVEAYNNGKLLLLVNAAPDANGYAVMNYVRDDIITFTKFLTSRSEAYGSFNTYYLHSDNTWEISKEVKLNKVEGNVNEEANSELKKIKIGNTVYYLPDTSSFATTKQFTILQEQLEKIDDTYVSEEYLEAYYVTNTALEEKNYITEQFVTNNYVTNETIEANYSTKEEIAETYVTNNEVNQKIENKVTEVIEQKMEDGNIVVNADSINYDTWDGEW